MYESKLNGNDYQVALTELEESADKVMAAQYFNCSPFKAMQKLHSELSNFIETTNL